MSLEHSDNRAKPVARNMFALEEATLSLMGCPSAAVESGAHLVQVLVSPMLFAPGCISFDISHSTVASMLTILQKNDLNALHDAFLSKNGEEWSTFPLSPIPCYREDAMVPEEMLAAARKLGAFLDDSELSRPSEQRRGGTTFFVRFLGMNPKNIWLHGPEPDEMPTHAAMLKTVRKIAMATFWREPAASYLASLFHSGRKYGA